MIIWAYTCLIQLSVCTRVLGVSTRECHGVVGWPRVGRKAHWFEMSKNALLIHTPRTFVTFRGEDTVNMAYEKTPPV